MSYTENLSAYELFVQARAEKTGQSKADVNAEIHADDFARQIHTLHQQWIAGEFSFGRFTELIRVPHWELWEILDALNLPRHK